MASLDADDVHALEQLRQRFQQLHNSLTSLQNNIAQNDPLPPWSSLQSQFTIISNNLQSVSKQLSQYQHLYGSTVAFPLPQFPGRTQEVLLQQLMRTRLEPGVQEWMEQGQTVAQELLNTDSTGKAAASLTELWEWAPGAANAEARKQHWGADFSRAEVDAGIEKVVSGLKRKLRVPQDSESGDEDEGSDEDEDAEEEEEAEDGDVKDDIEMTTDVSAPKVPPMPLESIFKFAMTGTLPVGASS